MAGDREIQFPEPVIQLLQSFLDGEEAARTAIVSKSWHSAWLTRPNLDFDDTYFGDDDFSEYAEKTIKRYEQLNLKIESFNLCMNINHKSRAELANKLIVKALRIGASRLCLRLKRGDSFVLPNEVFGADNLVELSVSGCTIDLDDGVVIKCRSLESLSLDDVVFMRYDTVRNIISSCPSIKNLSLLSDVYPHNYRKLWYFEHKDDEELDERAMAVGLVDNLIPRLRCLVLGSESFKTLCLGDLLSRFSFLKDFTLYLNGDINIYEETIQISNSSIERIKLVQVLKSFPNYGYVRRPRLKFDVPSIRKFTYEGISIPRLSFISTPPSREWESHVCIQCKNDEFPTCWFNELSELLTKLSQSKTHLSLHSGCKLTAFDYKVGDNIIEGLYANTSWRI
ncbi:hypothetical protein CASFOL_010206 [Castilleja foliolosa]|uniref:F-box domain-containing protein n=1 Tax=Castilleja foliolosa TaxID=1961234 RepID=A0ABD3DW28_9LAMI